MHAMTKCDDCGAPLRVAREDYTYAESGLSNVVLQGVLVRRCDCGYFEVDIPHIEELHRALAEVVTSRPGSLLPEEIRFLRKHIGLDQKTLAYRMGVTPVTVSRWETGARLINPIADRLLRVLALDHPQVRNYAHLDAQNLESAPVSTSLKPTSHGWTRGRAA